MGSIGALRLGLALLFTMSLPALSAGSGPDQARRDLLAEQAEERELPVLFGDQALMARAGGRPIVLILLEARHPELRYAGMTRDGMHRFLVSPEHADRIGDYRDSILKLGGIVGKVLPSPRIQSLYKARTQASRLGAPDVLGLIVKYRSAAKRKRASEGSALDSADLLHIAQVTGKVVRGSRAMYGEAYVAHFDTPTDLVTGELLAQRLSMSPDVERVELNSRVRTMLTASDPGFSLQWSLTDPVAGIRAPQAWDITTGSSNTIVGVVDTGILAHPDLAGRLLPGADTITSTTTSQDGNARDTDAADPGDFTPAGACGAGSAAEPSSWHGTHVAGIIAANANNGMGISGVDWRARIVPVRALGRCGGATADIIDGMAWAAGLTVPGLPVNANPAKVINMSLGGPGNCSPYFTTLVDVLLRGVLVVAAAGNENSNALEGTTPASCSLVLTVSAVDPTGDKASYSNYSSALEISAPGGVGGEGAVAGRIVSTVSADSEAFAGNYGYAYSSGTSQAAPHVSGVASLMLGVAPNLTVAQMRDVLQQTARSYPAGSRCATQKDCGPGILDGAAALARARALNGVSSNYSSLWYQPSESGWGVNLQQQGDVLFGTWFSYAADGRAVWYVMSGLQRVQGDLFSGDVFALTGVPFNQINGQEARRTLSTVGTAHVFFFNINRAYLVAEIGGATIVKQILTQVFSTPARTCDYTTASRAGLTNYTDLWWNQFESGWGINLDHQGDIIFATWFTYGSDGSPMWLVADEARKTSANTYSGTLYQTTGKRPQDISGTQSLLSITPVGTITLTFADGERGTFNYTVSGQSGSKAIRRQVWSSPLSQCR